MHCRIDFMGSIVYWIKVLTVLNELFILLFVALHVLCPSFRRTTFDKKMQVSYTHHLQAIDVLGNTKYKFENV